MLPNIFVADLTLMKKFFTLFLVLISFGIPTIAQKVSGSISGTLQDSATSTALYDATISIIKAQDSSLVSFTLSNNNGYFEIKNLDTSRYVLLVSYGGFQSLKKPFAITAANPQLNLGRVVMQQSFTTLDEVVVTDQVPVKVKGDTLVFNANSFKVNKPNATVEDLLKKLPGMQVEKDGTVKAQGENVQKVYVDGKEFFGNDPKLATKNLSADMIQEVELYDDMSEQAKFNGIDDGSRSKAINLKLKKDKKRGLFGQVSAGYGTDERFVTSARANFFKGATQVGVFANANNTNRVGFSSTDMLGLSGMGGGGFSGGGGRGMVMMGGGGGGNSGGGSGNGITTSSAAGINYNDIWSKALEINSNYNFNHSSNNNRRQSYRQTLLPTSKLVDDQTSYSKNSNNVNRGSFRLTYTINDKNSIVVSPNINFQNSEFIREDSTLSFIERDKLTALRNRTKTVITNLGDGINWNNNITWRKKFDKKGRTLSATFANTYGRNNSTGYNNSFLTDFATNGDKVRDSIINRYNTRRNKNDNYNLNLSYTEPIGRDKVWEVNYGYNNNESISDRQTYDWNRLTDEYDIVAQSLTNYFENINESHRLGTNMRFVKKKYNYQVGLSAQRTTLVSDNVTKNTLLKQSFTNLFPNASFNYQFARSKNLRFNYRGRTSQPSASQLQPVVDDSNPRNLRQGNPGLNQEFSNNFSLNYNFFNTTKFRNLFAAVNYSNTYNKIVNSTTLLDSFGKQLTVPVNVNGVYNINGNFNYGFPLKMMKGGNINATSRVAYNRNASMVNGAKNYIKNLNLGEDLRVNYVYKEALDLGITASVNYTSARYTIQQQLNNEYYTHMYSIDGTYTFPFGLVVSSDIDYTANSGLSAGYNQNYVMWNAAVAKQLFKSKKGEIRLSVFDLLNQNISQTRNVYDNVIEDVQTTVLNRFFMLSFTYNINRMGGKNMPGGGGRQPGQRMFIQQ